MEPLLEVQGLSVGYDGPLLRELSFTAQAGQMVGILGRNGCGKSTLMRGLSGSIRRFAGKVLVAGKDCAGLKPRQQAALLSLLPQQTELLEGITGRQLVEMGRYPYGTPLGGIRAADARIIEEYANGLGIMAWLEQDCAKLSQGQRQLVLLCRLLVQDTPVMLLDEPNAALDYDNTCAMFRILRQVVEQERKTALVVLHDPELALSNCHRVLIMKDGRLCRALDLAQASLEGVEEALKQIYPDVLLRRDPFNGHFRCYNE